MTLPWSLPTGSGRKSSASLGQCSLWALVPHLEMEWPLCWVTGILAAETQSCLQDSLTTYSPLSINRVQKLLSSTFCSSNCQVINPWWQGQRNFEVSRETGSSFLAVNGIWPGSVGNWLAAYHCGSLSAQELRAEFWVSLGPNMVPAVGAPRFSHHHYSVNSSCWCYNQKLWVLLGRWFGSNRRSGGPEVVFGLPLKTSPMLVL